MYHIPRTYSARPSLAIATSNTFAGYRQDNSVSLSALQKIIVHTWLYGTTWGRHVRGSTKSPYDINPNWYDERQGQGNTMISRRTTWKTDIMIENSTLFGATVSCPGSAGFVRKELPDGERLCVNKSFHSLYSSGLDSVSLTPSWRSA